jgi:hypothetical protein
MSVLLPVADQMVSTEINYKIRYRLLPLYTVTMTIKTMCKCCGTLGRCHLNSYSKCFLSVFRNVIGVHDLYVALSVKVMP